MILISLQPDFGKKIIIAQQKHTFYMVAQQ